MSASSLVRLLYAPVQAFLDSQVLINRQTRAIVEQYTRAPDLVVKRPYKTHHRAIQIPALTMAHVPSLSHRRMKVCLYVRPARTQCGKKVFRLTSAKRRKSKYKISFTIESTASTGLQRLQELSAEHIDAHSTLEA